jgi:hypothetical protein
MDPGRCPECGTVTTESGRKRMNGRDWLSVVLAACSPLLVGGLMCAMYGPVTRLMVGGIASDDSRSVQAEETYVATYLFSVTLTPLVVVPVVAWARSRRRPASVRRFAALVATGIPIAWAMSVVAYWMFDVMIGLVY